MIIKQSSPQEIETDNEGVSITIAGHSVKIRMVDDILTVKTSDAEVSVQKSVPIPTYASRTPTDLPFGDLQVGDSFSVPLSKEVLRIGINGTKRNAASRAVREKCRQFRQRHGNGALKFTIREVKEEGVVRCWRVA